MRLVFENKWRLYFTSVLCSIRGRIECLNIVEVNVGFNRVKEEGIYIYSQLYIYIYRGAKKVYTHFKRCYLCKCLYVFGTLCVCVCVCIYIYIAVLQIGRLMVRFQKVSLEFFFDIILPIALWPWGRLSL